jgi:hypothetical protein
MTDAVDAADAADVDTVVSLVVELGEVSERLTYLSNSIIVPFMGCFPVARLTTTSYNKYVDRMTDIESKISDVKVMAKMDANDGDGMRARTRAHEFIYGPLEEFYAAPLRQGGLVKYMSKPLLLTRLIKLLTHNRTGRYIGSLDEDSRQVSTYRTLEILVYHYAAGLEKDQAAYE